MSIEPWKALRLANVIKKSIGSLMALTPYRIVHQAENRFQAIPYNLKLLKSFGYRPKLVIDAGAHLGEFAKMASSIFPDAQVHMIEPQAACQQRLKSLTPQFHLHSFALGSRSDVESGLKLAASDTPNTGAYISDTGQQVPVATLDDLFDPDPVDRTLLKLDLQGFELHALEGAERIIGNIEIVLTEVSFFAQAYEPSISTLVRYLDDRGFDLFDIASLSGRARDNRLKYGDFVFARRGSSVAGDKRWA